MIFAQKFRAHRSGKTLLFHQKGQFVNALQGSARYFCENLTEDVNKGFRKNAEV